MKRNQIALVCGLALIGALAGCSKNETPKVTPTPTTAPPATVAPEPTHAPTTEPVNPTDTVAPTDHYDANADGQVSGGTTNPETGVGDAARNAVDQAGNVVGGAVRGTGRVIERVGEDIADAGRR